MLTSNIITKLVAAKFKKVVLSDKSGCYYERFYKHPVFGTFCISVDDRWISVDAYDASSKFDKYTSIKQFPLTHPKINYVLKHLANG